MKILIEDIRNEHLPYILPLEPLRTVCNDKWQRGCKGDITQLVGGNRCVLPWNIIFDFTKTYRNPWNNIWL